MQGGTETSGEVGLQPTPQPSGVMESEPTSMPEDPYKFRSLNIFPSSHLKICFASLPQMKREIQSMLERWKDQMTILHSIFQRLDSTTDSFS